VSKSPRRLYIRTIAALYLAGYHDRTASGHHGTLQLVSPVVVAWRRSGARADDFRGTIAVLNILFLSEPGDWLVLGVGLGFLAVLYRVRVRQSGEP
jgi:hypothetical protein